MKSLGWAITYCHYKKRLGHQRRHQGIFTQKECQVKRAVTWPPREEASRETNPPVGLAVSKIVKQ